MKTQSKLVALLFYFLFNSNAYAQFSSQGEEFLISTCSKELFYKQSLENIRRYQTIEKDAFAITKDKSAAAQFVKEIIKQLQNIISASVKKPVYFDVGPEQYYNINFRNGIYDLKTKEFRARNYTDYVTKFLEFDYKPKSEISKLSIDTVNEFFHKLQSKKNNENLL
jgi:phage/plasmid-associated DNA primase